MLNRKKAFVYAGFIAYLGFSFGWNLKQWFVDYDNRQHQSLNLYGDPAVPYGIPATTMCQKSPSAIIVIHSDHGPVRCLCIKGVLYIRYDDIHQKGS